MNPAQNPFGAPQGPAFGGGITESALHPVALVVLLIVIALTLLLPRRHALGPILCSIVLIPLGQQIVLGGIHWQAHRIVILFGLLRAIHSSFVSKVPIYSNGFTAIDRMFVGAVGCQAIAVLLLNRLDSAAFINQFGFVLDFLGGYVVVRAFTAGANGTYRALKWLAVAIAIVATGMVAEQITLRNVFGEIGGTQSVPAIREGKIRSQGSFQHAITAGVFAAALLPSFVLLWRNGKSKWLAAVGLVSSTVMTVCSASSTPLLAYIAGAGAICLWPIRRRMRLVRWGLVGLLAALQIVMKAPVWFLIARIDLTGGSSGYHRAELVDQFITHVGEWWLIGTNRAATWGYDMWDQQNQFVATGVTGGLAGFALFVAMIAHAWRLTGEARKRAEGTGDESLFWLLGVALFSSVVAFFGANLYDQSKIGWFLLLAMISASTSETLQMSSGAVKNQRNPALIRGPSRFWRRPHPRAQLDRIGLVGTGTAQRSKSR